VATRDGDGWVLCTKCQSRHWGLHGAAGLLLVRTDIEPASVLLQLRAAWTHGGGTWALPGGALDSHEEPWMGAAREAWEETLGSVNDYETLKQSLKSKNIKYIISKTPSGHPYYMYLVKIPYSFSYRDRFLSTKKFLANIKTEPKFLEMTDIKWVSLDTINYSIDNKRSFIKLRHVFEQTLKMNRRELLESLQM
jgi:8-oxo-dGTP pyrophosphatase MutT (NUDIX family)